MLTRKGERLYHPKFGCIIQDLLFENINDDSALQAAVDAGLRADINYWLPYIEIIRITTNVFTTRSGLVDSINGFSISMVFRVNNSNINNEIEIIIDNNGINLL